MDIGYIIDEASKKHSPYIGKLVNHLSMSQWAIYSITKDVDKVVDYTEEYIEKNRLEDLKADYDKNLTIEECLGKRDRYEECLYTVNKITQNVDTKEFVIYIINKYSLGFSSGLFHPIVRVAYALVAYEEYPSMEDELKRSVAYYITSYRETIVFDEKRKEYNSKNINKVCKSKEILDIIETQRTLGKRLKGLYSSDYYKENGFISKGNIDERIYKVLVLFGELQSKTNTIILFHCVMAMHALVLLRDYYEDYDRVVNIAITSVLSHLVAADIRYFKLEDDNYIPSWSVINQGIKEMDILEDAKLIYAIRDLDKYYHVPELRQMIYRKFKYLQ